MFANKNITNKTISKGYVEVNLLSKSIYKFSISINLYKYISILDGYVPTKLNQGPNLLETVISILINIRCTNNFTNFVTFKIFIEKEGWK